MYVRMETTNSSFNLLNLIANECYKTGQFYYSLKAFDILYNVDPHPDNWNGKRGAICGMLKMHIQDNSNLLVLHQLKDGMALIQQHNSTDALEVVQLINTYIIAK
eukprot:NODE_327_length_10929_cov_0.344137.p7 type:complete len:105 gc:universal NODE_327_length_10929_cov_0.344137:5098-4784(-)